MVQKIVTGFKDGMDRDTAFTGYTPNSYLEAENLRIVIDESGKTGTLNTVRGDKQSFILENGDDYTITTTCIVRDRLVVLATDNRNELFSIFSCYVGSINTGGSVYTIPKVYTISGLYYSYQCIARYDTVDGTSDKFKVYFNVQDVGICVIDILNLPTYSPTRIEYLQIVPQFLVAPCQDIAETGGAIKTGSVQYSYQLYNVDGQETMFVAASQLLPVTSTQAGQIKDYKGNSSGVLSTKGFTFTIENSSVPFNRIRVVRLQYSTINTLPEVIIVYEGEFIEGNTVTIIDTGQSLGSYTIDEFRFISNIIFPKYLEEKNSYLFAANIQQTEFDVDYDARAFRYKSNKTSYGSNADPETTDIVNPYNDLDNDSSVTYRYKYQDDGLTLGGSGANISYKFTTDYILLDDLSNDTLVTGDVTESYCNPLAKVGYQRDEIYRFGIVFFDYYGRQSYVHWIDDVRFPSIADYSLTDQIGGKLYGIILGIQFQVLHIPDSVYAYQIVRCQRDEANRTVVDCGICGHTEKTGSSRYFLDYDAAHTTLIYPRLFSVSDYDGTGANVLEYMTPEYNYNGKRVLNASKLYSWGICNNSVTSTVANIISYSGDNNSVIRKIYEYESPAGSIASIDSTVSLIQENSINSTQTIDTVNILKRIEADITSFTKSRATKGSTMMIIMEGNFYGSTTTGPMYVYRRNNSYPYGGASFGARQNSTYYPCGDIIDRTNTAFNTGIFIEVYSGDIYINMFEYYRGIFYYAGELDFDSFSVIHFPVESTINTSLKSNPTFNSQHDGTTSYSTSPLWVATQEVPGTYPADNNKTKYYIQDYSLYTYNSVYSQQDISKSFLAKPVDHNLTSTYEYMVTSSDKKLEDENTDSWCKFRFNNKINVNSKFGPITGLVNFKNLLMYTQTDAYGILSVEDREMQQSSNIGGFILGTGGVLVRFDYVNTDIGVKESMNPTKVNILPTSNALYMYDSNRKKIFRYTGEHEVISDTKGVFSLVSDISSSYPDIAMGYNRKYGEVYFTNEYLNKTLVFSELTNNFIGFYTVFTDMWVWDKNNLWAITTSNAGDTGYLQDISTGYNIFLGTYSPSTLTLIVNPQRVVPVRFDMVELNTESSTDSQSITSIQFDNSYQTSGVIPLVLETTSEELANFRRRFRTFRFNTIFDNDTYQNRFKDAYLKCKLTFTDPDTINHSTSLQIGEVITGYAQLPINRQ